MKKLRKILLFIALIVMSVSISSCGDDDDSSNSNYIDLKTVVSFAKQSKSSVESKIKSYGYTLDGSNDHDDYISYNYVRNETDEYSDDLSIYVLKSNNTVFCIYNDIDNDGNILFPEYKKQMNAYNNSNASFNGSVTRGTEDSITIRTFDSYSEFLSMLNSTSSIEYGFHAKWINSTSELETNFYDEDETYNNGRYIYTVYTDKTLAPNGFEYKIGNIRKHK
jgi:hypothetical protein